MAKFDEVLEGIEEKLVGIEVVNDDWTEFKNDIICCFETEEHIYVEGKGSSQFDGDVRVYTDESKFTVYLYMDGNKIKDAHVR